MEILVRETGDMVRVLEIKADASELETDVRVALKKQQSVTSMKGFRPGHVPLSMVRRLHMEEVKDRVVQNLYADIFEDMVQSNPKYNVLRGTREIHRDYELDGDLEVQIEFYVIPEIQLGDFTGQVLEIEDHEITETHIDIFIRAEMAPFLEFRPLKAGEKIAEGVAGLWDRVKFERVSVDRKTGFVIIGAKAQKSVELFDYREPEQYDSEEYDRLADALAGHSVGDRVFIEIENSTSSIEPYGLDHRIRVLDVSRIDWFEPNDRWADRISGGAVSTAEELRAWAREELEARRKNLNDEKLVLLLKERMMELYPFSIPNEVVKEFMEMDDGVVKEFLSEEGQLKEYMMEQMHWVFFLDAVKGQLLPSGKSSEDLTNPELIDALLDQFEVKRHYVLPDAFRSNSILHNNINPFL